MEVNLKPEDYSKIITGLDQENILLKRVISNQLSQADTLRTTVLNLKSKTDEIEQANWAVNLLCDWLVIFFKNQGYSSADMFSFLAHNKSEKELSEEITLVEDILKNRYNIGGLDE